MELGKFQNGYPIDVERRESPKTISLNRLPQGVMEVKNTRGIKGKCVNENRKVHFSFFHKEFLQSMVGDQYVHN